MKNKGVQGSNRIEEKLYDASLYTRNLIEVSLDPLVTINLGGKITDVNKATELVTGVSREKLIGSDFSDYFTEPEKARKGYQEVFKKGFVRDYPLAIRHISGGITYVMYNAAIYKNAAGEIVGVFAAARDITERKRAEDILAARYRIVEFASSHSIDELLRKTLDEVELLTGSQIGFFHFLEPDQKTIILQIWSTNTLEKMCTAQGKGHVYDISMAGVWVDCIHERRPVIHNDYPALPHKKGLPEGHAEVVRELTIPVIRNDKIVALLGVGNKISYYDKKDIQTAKILSDLAWDLVERKRADDKLLEASLYTRSLIEASLDPLVTISPKGKITDVNNATELVTGVFRAKLIGSDFSEYFTEPDKAREGYQQVFEKGYVRDYPLAIRHISGKITDVVYNASVYRDRMGRVAGVFAAARDITERVRAENELKIAHHELEKRVKERTSELAEANEALKAEIAERKKAGNNLLKSIEEKNILLKEIHHRVKNNLQIISSILYIQSKNMDDQKAITAFREGRNRVDTMALIHEKLYRGEDLARINFADYVEELSRNLFFFYGTNMESIKLNIDIIDVYFDINTAIPCGLIVNELVSNSLKYAFPEGRKGEISISLKPVENKFLLTIADNGIGIPANMDTTKTDTLGLKLVNSLVNQLDGTLKLDRTSGTSFEIIFSELKYKERG